MVEWLGAVSVVCVGRGGSVWLNPTALLFVLSCWDPTPKRAVFVSHLSLRVRAPACGGGGSWALWVVVTGAFTLTYQIPLVLGKRPSFLVLWRVR